MEYREWDENVSVPEDASGDYSDRVESTDAGSEVCAEAPAIEGSLYAEWEDETKEAVSSNLEYDNLEMQNVEHEWTVAPEFWEKQEDEKLNRIIVREYEQKRSAIEKQIRNTADYVYFECKDSLASDPRIMERFEEVRNNQQFEIYASMYWQRKLGDKVSPGQSGRVLGYHSLEDHGIYLNDSEMLYEAATHESVHALSYRGEYSMSDYRGAQHLIKRSGIRSIDTFTGEDIGMGLNEGFTQMYTERVLSYQREMGVPINMCGAYTVETGWAESLREIVGDTAIDKAYYSGDVNEIEQSVNNRLESDSGWLDLCRTIDQYQSSISRGDMEGARMHEQTVNEMLFKMRFGHHKELRRP